MADNNDNSDVGCSWQVSDRVVHLALLRPNREEFVELFLERGLKIHSYLNHKRLHNLFENPADRDFFVTVCLEGVLGKTVVSNDSKNLSVL